ncbi:MAG: family 43 glycosylhydrolase, partial [Alphaproteobacteria bacterium]|nr:family 43 glycosylhydrolase [Alphaproteobacteria bacterium]
EGGTGYDHAVTLARSRHIDGPYETHPDKHVMSTQGAPDHPVQRTGHGQYVEAPDGTAWHTYLMGRPLMHDGKPFCATGRETGIARCVWRDDWLYLEEGSLLPPEMVDAPADAAPRGPVVHARFDSLPPEFQWLRTPDPDRLFAVEDGALVLTGRESIGSWFEQSLVARRQEDAAFDASTTLDFAPDCYQQGAGLMTYYNRHKFHGAFVTFEGGQRCLTLMSCNGDWPQGRLDHPIAPVPIPDGPIGLRVEVRGASQQFFWSSGGQEHPLGPARDAYHVSDEGAQGEHASFTGAFVGMMAFDITGRGEKARFSSFSYAPVAIT